jgi:uncharacterized repeat protein (TIGR02543 family)
MKKITLFIVLLVAVVALAGCQDQQFQNDDITVIFFTANFGSTEVESYLNVEPNTVISEPEDPVREGFTFNGWFQDFYKTVPWDFDTDTVGDTSIVLYAKWTPNVYNIIYDTNGGEITTTDYPTQFTAGQSVILPFVRLTGYSFVAWYPYDWESEDDTIPGDPGFQSSPQEQYEDLYLYAHYEAVRVQVNFNVNYPGDAADAPERPQAILVSYGAINDFIVFDDTAEYTFMGWNSTPSGSGTFYNNGEPFERTQRITLYAIWQLIE